MPVEPKEHVNNSPFSDDPLATLIGQNVRERRCAMSIHLESAATALAIKRDDYRAAELGARRFTARELVNLCDLLDVMPSKLFGDV